jgi:tryptophan synthase alpha chain
MITGKKRIDAVFAGGKKPLVIAFTVAGDPDYGTSLAIIREMAASGVDLIELGLPFSDPVADGPVIQRADLRAKETGMNTDKLFNLVSDFRVESNIPVVVLSYANPILRRGISGFYQNAAQAGIDGVVIADVPYEESFPFVQAAQDVGIVPIMMISPTTSTERLEAILGSAAGFIYLVAVKGITGMRTGVDQAAIQLLKEVKKKTSIPVAPGFGISTPEQVREWTKAGADAVIVGSAFVKKIEENLEDTQAIIEAVSKAVRTLSQPI